jgi:hypothetical protein
LLAAPDGAFRLHDVYGAFRCYSCATALGVRYASQQVSQQGRKYLQSQRLRRFLGEYPDRTTIHKPLFMHRKTYSALLTRLRQIELAFVRCPTHETSRIVSRLPQDLGDRMSLRQFIPAVIVGLLLAALLLWLTLGWLLDAITLPVG